MDYTSLIYAVLSMGGLGLLLSMGLAIANKKLHVEEDPRIALTIDLLPGANCGGCGYAGCANFAENLVAGKTKIASCPVCTSETTEKIAKSIGNAISGENKVLHASEVNLSELESIGFLIVGSPTYAGRPTPPVQNFLSRIPESALKDINVAAFDTRVSTKFAKIFGYAASKIASSLKAKGGTLILSPEGFFVKGKEGPLKDGEEERAASWVRKIINSGK